MRKAILVASALMVTVYSLMAQRPSKKDSLKGVYANIGTPDTTRSMTAISLSKLYRNLNADSADFFARAAFDIADRIQFDRGKASALNVQGLIRKDKGEQVKAIAFFRLSIKAYQRVGDTRLTANGYNNLGLTYDDVLKKKEALASYDSALILFQTVQDIQKTAETLNNFGQSFRKNGDYLASLDYYLRALKIYRENNGEQIRIKMVLGNIGVVYEKMKNYPEAVSYFKQALELIPADNQYSRAATLSNMGNSYSMAGDYVDAEKSLTEAQHLLKGFDGELLNSAVLSSLAYVKIKTGKPGEAIGLLHEAYPVAVKVNHPEGQAVCLNNFAEAYLLLGDFKKAHVVATQALRISKLHHLDDQQAEALRNLSNAAIRTGDYKTGYELLGQRMKLNDSLFNEKTVKRFYEIEKEYEVDKKQSEITLLAKQNEIKELQLVQARSSRQFLLVGLVVAFGLVVIIYFFYTAKARLSSKLSEQYNLINSINHDLQAQALRAQMNPHFIFNSLNSIQFLIAQKESTKAIDYLSKFALLLRNVMDNSEKNFIPLSEEIEILNLYLQLESLRFDGSFDYTIDSSVPNASSLRVPPLVVQPYIENAIQYGLMPKAGDRQLNIRFSQQPHSLLCEVRDNGIGRAEAMEISKRKRKLFSSRGINYTAQRIKVMNNMFDGKSNVTIVDMMENGKAKGTLVAIEFAYA